MGVLQQAGLEAFLLKASAFRNPGQQADARLQQHLSRNLPSRQHIIPDRNFLEFPGFNYPFVQPLEPATQQNDPGFSRELRTFSRSAAFRAGTGKSGVAHPAPTLSIAAAATSARITIPAPPPDGVSSTVRCSADAECPDRSTASSSQSPWRRRVPTIDDPENAGEGFGKEGQAGDARKLIPVRYPAARSTAPAPVAARPL